MTLDEILSYAGGGVAALSVLVEIAPVKVNPWSALFRWLGKAINGDVLKKLSAIEADGKETRKQLEEHVRKDDERAADGARQRILRFNDEIKRDKKHTEEHFNEVLDDIDRYETYCRTHEDYKNSKAVHAIANILRVYDERLEKNDFL